MARRISGDLRKLIKEFKDVVHGLVADRKGSYKNDPDYRWAAALWHREDSRRTLVAIHELGGDVGKLLTAGGWFRCDKAWFMDAITQIRFGAPTLAGARHIDPEDLSATIDKLEEMHGGPVSLPRLPPGSREICESIRRRNEELGDGGGKYVPGSAFTLAMPEIERTETEASFDREGQVGRNSDPAENTIAVLVAGHLLAVSGERNATLAARFIADVLQIPSPSAPGTDHEKSFRRRIETRFGSEAVRRRVKLLADMLGLPVRFD